MKINIWIEVCPSHIGNDGRWKDIPHIQSHPFEFPCSANIKRFKAVIEIPYELLPSPITELDPIKATEEKNKCLG